MRWLLALLLLAPLCADEPITLSSYYATDIGGNPIGGEKQRAMYCGFFDVGVAIDLNWANLRISNYLASGANLSNSIDNIYGVQEVYASGNYFFGILDLSIPFFNDTVIWEVGRLLAGDVFATSSLWEYYLTSGVNGNIESLEYNIVFPQYNIAAWATRLTFEPNQTWRATVGLYHNPPEIQDPNTHGLYWRFDKDLLAIGQIDYRHHTARSKHGLPGRISAGGYYNSQPFDAYGFYVFADQMLFRGKWPEFAGPDHLRATASHAEQTRRPYHYKHIVAQDRPTGLTFWTSLYASPVRPQNIQLYQFGWGLLYQGLCPSRPFDVAAFGMVRGKFPNTFPGQEAETVLELNYRIQKNDAFYITPDVQYVIKPSGRTTIPDALVLNIEMCIHF